MTQLLIATTERSRLNPMAAAMQDRQMTIQWAGSIHEVLEFINRNSVDLVIADEFIGNISGLKLIKQVITDNPMMNCAAVSSLSAEAFHEASEGLGILMQLPPAPSPADGKRLLSDLNRILGLSTQSITRT